MNFRYGFLSILILLTSNAPVLGTEQAVWAKTNLESSKVSAIEASSYGIVAGENDGRAWLNPYNGVFISKDLGKTWQSFGLEKRAITDLEYSGKGLLASTYYHHEGENGLFIWRPEELLWVHRGPNVSLNTVWAKNELIAIGGFSHGLWISRDNGVTWIQKIGDGFYGPQIWEIEGNDKVLIASTNQGVYRSLDQGETWGKITILEEKSIRELEIVSDIVWAGSSSKGLYYSTDLGLSWKQHIAFENSQVLEITGLGTRIFVSSGNSGLSSIMHSHDLGKSWNQLSQAPNNNGQIVDLKFLYTNPGLIIGNVQDKGLYQTEVPGTTYEADPIFRIPWEFEHAYELIENIFSYFDHKYPLLGYPYKKEPIEEDTLTMNYLGENKTEPFLYYSSHDGYDFSLPYGTNIVAAAEGTATYGYEEHGLGNYISIEHPGRYKTVYAHLQTKDLVTRSSTFVDTGQIIGKVGMTGNTTGPHLHFVVYKNEESDSEYKVENKIDPFAWQSDLLPDPWADLQWSDAIGTHKSFPSRYLWQNSTDSYKLQISPEQSKVVQFQNKKLYIESEIFGTPVLLKVQPYSMPHIGLQQSHLRFLESTSFLLNAFNVVGENVSLLKNPLKIEISYQGLPLTNIKESSLKLYFFNPTTELWEGINSHVDAVSKTITANLTHFSAFAVLGEKPDPYNPTTTASIIGQTDQDWYIEAPTVTLQAQDIDYQPIQSIFYSLNNVDWHEYVEPFPIQNEGITIMFFRAQDMNGNLESTKDIMIKVDTHNRYNHRPVSVNNSAFSTQP